MHMVASEASHGPPRLLSAPKPGGTFRLFFPHDAALPSSRSPLVSALCLFLSLDYSCSWTRDGLVYRRCATARSPAIQKLWRRPCSAWSTLRTSITTSSPSTWARPSSPYVALVLKPDCLWLIVHQGWVSKTQPTRRLLAKVCSFSHTPALARECSHVPRQACPGFCACFCSSIFRLSFPPLFPLLLGLSSTAFGRLH